MHHEEAVVIRHNGGIPAGRTTSATMAAPDLSQAHQCRRLRQCHVILAHAAIYNAINRGDFPTRRNTCEICEITGDGGVSQILQILHCEQNAE
jgi:hypothetical protein